MLSLPLSKILLLDAFTCAAMAVLLLLFGNATAAMTHIPKVLLFYAAIILIPCALFMLVVALKASEFKPAVWFIVVGNVAWFVASVLMLISGLISPNALGFAFVLIQAAAVAGLTICEFLALRNNKVAATA